MIPFEEARRRVVAAARPTATETVPIGAAAGRVLARPVLAQVSNPPFNASAMDGYAVAGAEVSPGSWLQVSGEIQAGSVLDRQVQPGQAVRIFTGAALPAGADAVIIQELAERDGDRVRFTDAASAGQNVRRAGQDFCAGSEVLAAGKRLTAAAVGLAAAANAGSVEVHRRPTLALLSTGDELVAPGTPLAPGEIVGSNNLMLSALFADLAKVDDRGSVPDDNAALERAFSGALQGEADLVVTTGGASVGDHDLVQPVLKSLGVEVDFWKIAMRPGKPLMFGRRGETLVMALPGNPVSAFVTALMIVLPLLRATAGLLPAVPQPLRLALDGAIPANGPRTHFMRGSLVTIDGHTRVRAFSQTDSAHLSSLAAASVLIEQPANSPELVAGSDVTVWPIPG